MKAKAQMTMHEPSHVASMESPNCTPEKLQAGDGWTGMPDIRGKEEGWKFIYTILEDGHQHAAV